MAKLLSKISKYSTILTKHYLEFYIDHYIYSNSSVKQLEDIYTATTVWKDLFRQFNDITTKIFGYEAIADCKTVLNSNIELIQNLMDHFTLESEAVDFFHTMKEIFKELDQFRVIKNG